MRKIMVGLMGVFCFFYTFMLFADAVTVSINQFAFDPPEITITPGQIVTWVNNDEEMQYQLDSVDRSVASNLIIPHSFYSQQFNTPGTYPYFCANYPTMTGTVIVQPISTYIKNEVKTQVKTEIQQLNLPPASPPSS